MRKKKITSVEALFEEDEESLAALAGRFGVKLKKTKDLNKKKVDLARAPAAPLPPESMGQSAQDSLAGLAHNAKAALGKPKAAPEDLPKPLRAPKAPEPVEEPPAGRARVTAGSIQHPPGPFKAWEHHSDRMDKGFADPHDEFHNFVTHVQDPHAEMAYRTLGGYNPGGAQKGVNQTIHGKINVPGKESQGFFAKPHEGISGMFNDPDLIQAIGKRQEATYKLGSMMGASHMVIPGKNMILPSRASKGEDDRGDHYGKMALVSKAMDADPMRRHKQLDLINNLDPEESQHAMIFHTLTGHRDAHANNVLIRRDEKGNPHPVLMDWDMAMAPHEYNKAHLADEKEAAPNVIKSVFSPGNPYDYTRIGGPVGKNYSPRTKATLDWIAKGGHEDPQHGLGLDPEDSKVLGKNANDLLNHGLEGTLNRRILL